MHTRGTARTSAPLVCALAALTLVLGAAGAVRAQTSAQSLTQGQPDQVLPGCGICYPGGYDPNTVGTITGRISDIVVPEDGPVRFVLAAEDDRWTVLASPAWFWKMADLRLADGDLVVVRGSKSLGADGKLYVVAQSIGRADAGPATLLRDARGVPLWRGGHGGGGMHGGGMRNGDGSGQGPGPGRTRSGGGAGRR